MTQSGHGRAWPSRFLSAPSSPVNVRFRNQSGRSGADQDLIDFDPRCLDDSLPLLGICFQDLREFVRGGAFDGVGVTCELLDESPFYESFGKVATYLLHYRRWRLDRRKNALPRVNLIARDGRLGDGRHLWFCWGSLGASRRKYTDLA